MAAAAAPPPSQPRAQRVLRARRAPDAVRAAAEAAGWEVRVGEQLDPQQLAAEGARGDTHARRWDVLWAPLRWVSEHGDWVALRLRPGQRVNHFVNAYELTNKAHLSKNLARRARALKKRGAAAAAAFAAGVMPPTFLLPNDYALFLEERRRGPKGRAWIAKPVGGAQGRGIEVMTDASQWQKHNLLRVKSLSDAAAPAERVVMQEYVADPLLVGGKKFDLRLYVLVTSFSPLIVYTHRLGFARFTKKKFAPPADDADQVVHLTNSAIQNDAGGDASARESSPNKWSVSALRRYLTATRGRAAADGLFRDVDRALLEPLHAVQHIVQQDRHRNCFELYGFDVMVTRDLRPVLLEVNSSPSLNADSAEDLAMKRAIVRDTLEVLERERPGAERGRSGSVGGFDLIHGPEGPLAPEQSLVGAFVSPRT